MSRNNKAVTNSKKPYCKVCHDAGKSESVYTNHWVRSLPDRNGKTNVTCPTLLSNECRYCFKVGHTAKFCPVIEQNNKARERNDRQIAREEEEVKKKVKIEKSKPARGFAALQDDSDSESEEVKVSTQPNIVEEFPALGAPTKTQMAVRLPSVKQEAKSGWADALAKPKPTPEKVEEQRFLTKLEERSMIKNLPQSALKPQKISVTKGQLKLRASEMNWADLDSESDSDEENIQFEFEDEEDWQPSAYMKDTIPNAYRYSVPQPLLGVNVDDEDW
jgi:hypothetical protein